MLTTFIASLLGMAIQAGVTAILLKTGAIKVTPAQQFLSAIGFGITALVLGIIGAL